ncbi:helix-turn-helix domain-containing protein [Branchiibius cervicis]|uniref:Helix-turn-helix domain-containing protein n=1 Tax=Branchiibius cervicis TaxID=908252 RepID=A0ABW2AVN8_9MICO
MTYSSEQIANEDELFARNLRRQRESLGWSQAELAERLQEAGLAQIYPTTVSRIEKGERIVRLSEGAQIARTLQTDISAMTRLLPEEAAELREAMIDVELAAGELRRAATAFEKAQLKLLDSSSVLGDWMSAHGEGELDAHEESALEDLVAAAREVEADADAVAVAAFKRLPKG